MNKIHYIEIIKKCPYCNSDLIIINNNGIKILKCNNEQCPQRLINRIEHFCSKTHGIDIKGLGKQTISLLCDWGWVNGIRDIFELDRYKTEWISKAGFGQASVGKILDNINASKNGVQLYKFISAIGIPLIGSTVAKEIVKHYPTWTEFRAAIGSNWYEIEGFGPEMDRAINNFDYTEADDIASLLTFAEDQPSDTQSQSTAIKDKVFVVTGKLHSFKNRDALKADIEANGGKVTGSVSSKTNYLISNEDSSSAKSIKAKELGVTVITEDEYLTMRQ